MSEEGFDIYGDTGLSSADAKVPRWLFWSYPILIIWGFIWLFFFWDGSRGWLDRGYWHQLEEAANTTRFYSIEKEANQP